jgi:CubicO group peptidase (beta-lactamase class C family)
MPHTDSIEPALRTFVDAGLLAGAATLVWRDGRVAHTATVGSRDLVTNLPVERDTIFRIASMTKPLTTVAALMLYEEGRFALDEPIARHAPELANVRVLRDPNGPLDQTDAAGRPITFRDLLTHRSGLTYG